MALKTHDQLPQGFEFVGEPNPRKIDFVKKTAVVFGTWPKSKKAKEFQVKLSVLDEVKP